MGSKTGRRRLICWFACGDGLDAEYSAIGRVARRIWAVAMREKYGASPGAQQLKHDIQASGRPLHAQEMDFDDMRTTLQALCAIYDNCNSLHTNAYDEAVTNPSAHSVRRALAIQLIIDKEWGLASNENPLQGSFVLDQLADLVQEAGRAAPPQGGGGGRTERLRGPDRGGQALLARPDQRGVLRGRRAVPA